ncbi:MAG: NAD(P)/FAD-dependent oxidoreductase [Desulfovibrionales bacterium]
MPDARFDAVVLGAGASGLMTALTAAVRGRKVAVLDHMDRVGAKVKISGGGRCNVTNSEVAPEHYSSANPHFVKSALARFGPGEVLRFLDGLQIRYHEENGGKIFLLQGGRKLVSMLERECARAGVRFFLSGEVGRVMPDSGKFRIDLSEGTVHCRALVVATGGLSWPSLGASDLGYRLAAQFGHGLVPVRPGLVPLIVDDPAFSALSGISLPATLTCCDKRFTGPLLFTHKGVSGPVVLQASTFWTEGTPIQLDFLPERELRASLTGLSGKILVRNGIARWMPARAVGALFPRSLLDKQVAQLSRQELELLSKLAHCREILPQGTEGFAKAEVTAGGVDTREVSSRTMESVRVKGLYFTGELLDVTGMLGGYNLQWAWSSGRAAGLSL